MKFYGSYPTLHGVSEKNDIYEDLKIFLQSKRQSKSRRYSYKKDMQPFYSNY